MESDKQVRAVVITGYETAELLPTERNDSPLGPREVEGSSRVTLISSGTELASAYANPNGGYPCTPGYAAIFEVEAVGEQVRSLKPGDLAFCMGGHRSHQRVSEEYALRLPDGLKPEHAVFARLMGVTMSTLTTTTARPSQTILITGLGLVGHLAAQTFARCGYAVVACDPVESRRAIAAKVGIRDVRAAVPLDDPEIAGHVALVLECSGNERAALDACRVVRKRGEVVLVGTPWSRKSDLTAYEFVHAVFHQYAVVRSGWEWEVPLLESDFRTGSLYGNIAAAMRWIAEGSVRVEELYQAVSPKDAQSAYQDLLHQRCDQLGIVFDWTRV